MRIIFYILCVLLSLYIIDYLLVYAYVLVSRKADISGREKIKSLILTRGGGGLKRKIIRYLARFAGGWVRFSLIHLGRIPCHTYRNFILRHIYKMDIDKNVAIYGGFEIRSPWNIHIGQGTIIGDNAILDGRNGLFIGKNVNFSTGVNIWTEQHDMNDSNFACTGGAVKIGDRAWISTRAIVLPGIEIKEGSVIAGGAVVTKDCEAYTFYAGVPAVKKGIRNKNLDYELNGSYMPFY